MKSKDEVREQITTIILTKNEEKNIRDAIMSAYPISSRIVVIDCGSDDKTVTIAKDVGAEVFFHEWEGHARQFNWALDNCNIKTTWVFRLDADERISNELADEICIDLSSEDSKNINGYEMRWQIFFMNRRIKHGGTHRHYFLRLFRYGTGRVQDTILDEHIIVDGNVKRLSSDLIHYDYKGLDEWLKKHIHYSNLECQLMQQLSDGTSMKDGQKTRRIVYYRLPFFIRAKLYFFFIFFIQLGFLDGTEGRIFHYLRAYWYRYLVDVKLYESRKNKTQ